MSSPGPAHPPVMVASGLVKRYGSLVAVDRVDLTIRRGEALAVMGASGSGKTTLMHCLAAVIAPDEGSVQLLPAGGEPVELVGMSEDERSRVRRASVGFVFQEHLLLPELTALENAALPLLVLGVPRREAEAHAAGWLGALGLAGLEQRRIGQLSGGQAQRVAIARANVTGAEIVFADEPTGALDSHTSAEVMAALRHATVGQGRSLVVVTHDDTVAAACDRVLQMRDGHLEVEVEDPAGGGMAEGVAPVAVPVDRIRGPVRRVLTLATLLARPSRQGRAALVLPVVAFAVTTSMVLVVAGGAQMFFTDPRAEGQFGYLYVVMAGLALLLLTVPIATLGAAAARLSSRRREDRLATLRLLGASSAEVSSITVLEASATALVGACVGVLGYAALLPLVGLLPFFGGPVGIQAVWAGWGIIGLAVVAVSALAAISASVGLRRVRLTPLGVRRRSDPPPRRLLVAVIGIVLAAAAVVIVPNLTTLASLLGPTVALVFLLGGFAGALALVNVVGAPIIAARGRSLARGAADPARLIAGRELDAHSTTAWRRVSSVSMLAFISVVGGAGVSLGAVADDEAQRALFADIRTGVLLTLAIGFVVLACSVSLTQAAAVLEDRELLVGLHRLGMPADQMRRVRRITVLLPLRWAVVGGVVLGTVLALPFVGIALLVQPVTLLVLAITVGAGFVAVWGGLAASNRLASSIVRE